MKSTNKLALFSCALASPLLAENSISVYAGAQNLAPSQLDGAIGDDTIDSKIHWQGRSFDAPTYYGMRYMRWRGDYGLGVEFTHAKVYAPAGDMPDGFTRLEFSDGHNIATVNLARRWQYDKWTSYLSIGAGAAIPHVDIQYGQDPSIHNHGYQITGPAARLGAGVAYPLSAKTDLFAEYQTTFSHNTVDLDNDLGTLKTDLTTNAINIGLRFKF